MIKRVEDSIIFNNEILEKIAKIVENKQSIRLFDIVDSEAKANLIKKELKIQGYQVKIEPYGDKFKVFAIMPDKLKFEEAVNTGLFKKLAWGRYSFTRQNDMYSKIASLESCKYDFDDGTIWRVITDDSGQEYLVKETNDDNSDDVVRTKTASYENIIVDDNNVKTVLKILYDNLNDNDFVNDVLGSRCKSDIYSMLNEKLINVVDNNIQKNNFIKSPEYTADLHSIVKTAINESKLESKQQLESLIYEHTNQMISAVGKMKKLFN